MSKIVKLDDYRGDPSPMQREAVLDAAFKELEISLSALRSTDKPSKESASIPSEWLAEAKSDGKRWANLNPPIPKGVRDWWSSEIANGDWPGSKQYARLRQDWANSLEVLSTYHTGCILGGKAVSMLELRSYLKVITQSHLAFGDYAINVCDVPLDDHIELVRNEIKRHTEALYWASNVLTVN